MQLVLITLVVFLLAFAAMAIGVILGGRRLQGSCGGLSAGGQVSDCGVCGGTPSDCPEGASDTPTEGTHFSEPAEAAGVHAGR